MSLEEHRRVISALVAWAREERAKSLKSLVLFEANGIRIGSHHPAGLLRSDLMAHMTLLKRIIADMDQIIEEHEQLSSTPHERSPAETH